MGAAGSSLYNGSLSVYFVAVIKFGMKDKTFKKKLEFWCHFIPSAYAIGSSIFLQAGGYFNSMGGEYYIIDNRLLTMICCNWQFTNSSVVDIANLFADIMCWISAVPIECLSDSDIECSRGGKDALIYRTWLGLSIFPIVFSVIFVNMILIIHSVLVQKQKSDRYRLRTSGADNSCGSRIARYFLCFTSCIGGLFMTIKLFICRDKSFDEKRSNTIKYDNNSLHLDRVSGSAPSGNADPLPPLHACLEPVKILPIPPCCNNPGGPGKSPQECEDGEGDEECGPTVKRLAPPSRSRTSIDRYSFNIASVRSSIKMEALKDVSVLFAKEEDAEDKRDHPARTVSLNPMDSEELNGLGSNDARRYRLRPEASSSRRSASGEPNFAAIVEIEDRNDDDDENVSPRQDNVEGEVVVQALFYMGCFFITYIFGLISRIIQVQGSPVPYTLILLGRFFYPLQGFLNIIVYTRPHIVSLRRNNPQYSWFKAFAIVFRAGGDNDSVGQHRRTVQPRASNAEIRRRQELVERDFKRRKELLLRRSSMSESFLAARRAQQTHNLDDHGSRCVESSSDHDNGGSENVEMMDLDEQSDGVCIMDVDVLEDPALASCDLVV